MLTRNPNFFIIGAPKCGTTSLSAYLSEHPEVFFSKSKEPHYFCFDFKNYRGRFIGSYEQYLKAYFNDIKEQHKAIGEGSATYLYSKVAIREIKKVNPNSKIIVMLRNPVDMAYSFHAEKVWSGEEDIPVFEEAWNIQYQRKIGKYIPKLCTEPKFLFYEDVCKLGDQLERVYNLIPEKNIKVVLFDDFIKNTIEEYGLVEEFLGLTKSNREIFVNKNPSKQVKSKLLHILIVSISLNSFALKLRKYLNKNYGLGQIKILTKLKNINKSNHQRSKLNNEIKLQLLNVFEDDIHKIEKITNRDLCSWLKI